MKAESSSPAGTIKKNQDQKNQISLKEKFTTPAYTFLSDKSKVGFNGLVNDGNYVDIYDFEKQVLTYRHFEDIKNRFINKPLEPGQFLS